MRTSCLSPASPDLPENFNYLARTVYFGRPFRANVPASLEPVLVRSRSVGRLVGRSAASSPTRIQSRSSATSGEIDSDRLLRLQFGPPLTQFRPPAQPAQAQFTPLHLACQQGHNQSARLLLMAGAKIGAKNSVSSINHCPAGRPIDHASGRARPSGNSISSRCHWPVARIIWPAPAHSCVGRGRR